VCIVTKQTIGVTKDTEIRGRELFRKLRAADVGSCRHRRALSFALLRPRRAAIRGKCLQRSSIS